MRKCSTQLINIESVERRKLGQQVQPAFSKTRHAMLRAPGLAGSDFRQMNADWEESFGNLPRQIGLHVAERTVKETYGSEVYPVVDKPPLDKFFS